MSEMMTCELLEFVSSAGFEVEFDAVGIEIAAEEVDDAVFEEPGEACERGPTASPIMTTIATTTKINAVGALPIACVANPLRGNMPSSQS